MRGSEVLGFDDGVSADHDFGPRVQLFVPPGFDVRVAHDLVRIGFLLERRWAPYSKWLTTAFAQVTLADQVGGHLRHALSATRWREREAALCAAANDLAAATNRPGLGEPVDPAPRRFHSRDIQVLGAERLTRALTDAISDPQLRALLSRLGHRPDGPLGHLPGAIDQAIDSVEILIQPERRRDYAPVLGLRA